METARERNLRLVRAYVQGELHAGREFLEARIAARFPGLLGSLARVLVHAIGESEIRRRLSRQLDYVASAAAEADAIGLEAAVAKWAPRALETEEAWHRGNRRHPRFPEVERRLRGLFADRVAVFRPMLAYDGPATTYEELVRAVYPDPADARGAVGRQMALAREVTDLVRAEPDLVRVPRALLDHIFPLVDEVADWYEAHAEAEIRRIWDKKG